VSTPSGCPAPLYTSETGSLCYWVPDKDNKVKLAAALDLCRKASGQLATLKLRDQFDHVKNIDLLKGNTNTR